MFHARVTALTPTISQRFGLLTRCAGPAVVAEAITAEITSLGAELALTSTATCCLFKFIIVPMQGLQRWQFLVGVRLQAAAETRVPTSINVAP